MGAPNLNPHFKFGFQQPEVAIITLHISIITENLLEGFLGELIDDAAAGLFVLCKFMVKMQHGLVSHGSEVSI